MHGVTATINSYVNMCPECEVASSSSKCWICKGETKTYFPLTNGRHDYRYREDNPRRLINGSADDVRRSISAK